MDKVVCYAMTRNLYPKIGPSLRSLIKNSKPDRVYILAEDDTLPFRTPSCVQIINVSGQTWFRASGPNYSTKWTWMVLMKCVLPEILPTEERVLMLDVDTLVLGDICELFQMNLDGYYLAGAQEPMWTGIYKRLYVNVGSIVMNLSEMRKDALSAKLVQALNTKSYTICEQDCINEICKGRILEIPSKWNATSFTLPTDEVIIRHFAANGGWYERPEVQAWIPKRRK